MQTDPIERAKEWLVAHRNEDSDDHDKADEIITDLLAAVKRVPELEADLEICMEALDRLAYPVTLGPAVLSNLCKAGENEVRVRAEYAHAQRVRTALWKRTEAEIDAVEQARKDAQ